MQLIVIVDVVQVLIYSIKINNAVLTRKIALLVKVKVSVLIRHLIKSNL